MTDQSINLGSYKHVALTGDISSGPVNSIDTTDYSAIKEPQSNLLFNLVATAADTALLNPIKGSLQLAESVSGAARPG